MENYSGIPSAPPPPPAGFAPRKKSYTWIIVLAVLILGLPLLMVMFGAVAFLFLARDATEMESPPVAVASDLEAEAATGSSTSSISLGKYATPQATLKAMKAALEADDIEAFLACGDDGDSEKKKDGKRGKLRLLLRAGGYQRMDYDEDAINVDGDSATVTVTLRTKKGGESHERAAPFRWVLLRTDSGWKYSLNRSFIANRARAERKQVGDLMSALQLIATDGENIERLSDPAVRDKAGREFYEWALIEGLEDEWIVGKLVSLGSRTDSKAIWEEGEPRKLSAKNCSYTSPRAGELTDILIVEDRTVVIAFNSRNWNNYPKEGVLAAWAPGNVIEYMTFEDASRDWGITRAEWDDPAGKLFGKKAPFKHTYE